jgi:protein subunit release factor A
MLPDAKLDAILARHAALEAELSGQLSPEAYVKASREFSELSPIIDSVKRYRALLNELADLDALLADPSTDPEMRPPRRSREGNSRSFDPEGCNGRTQRHSRNPRRDRRRRSFAVRW